VYTFGAEPPAHANDCPEQKQKTYAFAQLLQQAVLSQHVIIYILFTHL
jgi:hypothetical protein